MLWYAAVFSSHLGFKFFLLLKCFWRVIFYLHAYVKCGYLRKHPLQPSALVDVFINAQHWLGPWTLTRSIKAGHPAVLFNVVYKWNYKDQFRQTHCFVNFINFRNEQHTSLNFFTWIICLAHRMSQMGSAADFFMIHLKHFTKAMFLFFVQIWIWSALPVELHFNCTLTWHYPENISPDIWVMTHFFQLQTEDDAPGDDQWLLHEQQAVVLSRG